MDVITISSKYRMVIPQKVRLALGLKPGQKLQVFFYENRVELIPIQPIQAARGGLKGIDTSIDREAEDRG